jgi:hypothetical protein
LSKLRRIASLKASLPSAIASKRSPTGTTSPSFRRSRCSTRICSITLSAVRSRWSSDETATSACTSAGLNG